MNEAEVLRLADKIHKDNTRRVVDLLKHDSDLHNLHTVLNARTAEIYSRFIPRYAQLCELDQARGLNDTERADLAVTYASLYPTFGDAGIVHIAAMWILTKPIRQARWS